MCEIYEQLVEMGYKEGYKEGYEEGYAIGKIVDYATKKIEIIRENIFYLWNAKPGLLSKDIIEKINNSCE